MVFAAGLWELETLMPAGYLSLVLHAHLPYIRHPEHPEFLEEDWLFEAMTETYIPLLRVLDRLAEEQVEHRLAMVLSPTLCEMLADPLLQERFSARLDRLAELANKETARQVDPRFHATAEMYRRHFEEARETFERRCGRNLVRGFRAIQEAGRLEILTTGATHGFFPNMIRSEAVRAQVKAGVANYRKHFGRPPQGMWLPECGYASGMDSILVSEGIRFFFLDAHGILNGSRIPKFGVHAPIRTPAGAYAFGRDLESSKQVWSTKEGYPGDANYREFYRDLGFDADEEYIRPYLHPDGRRRNIGIKYHRITGAAPLDAKEPYDPDAARAKAAEHAGHFMSCRQHEVRHLARLHDRAPIVVAPYDAELFGHWWFEGPLFLEAFLRKASCDQSDFRLIFPSEFLQAHPRAQTMEPSASTWGDKGYSEVWLNGANDWIYRHQHEAEERMIELARSHPLAEGLVLRALNQAAREVLLAESSDWAFIMTTGAAIPYAHRRFKEHIQRFSRLWEQIRGGAIEEGYLAECERRTPLFREMDYRVFGPASTA